VGQEDDLGHFGYLVNVVTGEASMTVVFLLYDGQKTVILAQAGIHAESTRMVRRLQHGYRLAAA
jgi:sulfate adenylyltransferase subunit 1 (EFTu-like GTPase family)